MIPRKRQAAPQAPARDFKPRKTEPLPCLQLLRPTCQDRPPRHSSLLCAERRNQWASQRSSSKRHRERHREHRVDSTRCRGQWVQTWVELVKRQHLCLWTVLPSRCSPACRRSQRCRKSKCRRQRNRLCSERHSERLLGSGLHRLQALAQPSRLLLILQA